MNTIKTTNDGSKLMSFNGIEFWVNIYGVIMQSNNWNVVDQLVAAGLATRKFYKGLLGHTEYKVKQMKCLCGSGMGGTHDEFCPFPFFGWETAKEQKLNEWQAEWETSRKAARENLGITGCCKRPLVDDDCMAPGCELYVPKAGVK